MLSEKHKQIIYKLIHQTLQLCGSPPHIDVDDLFQSAYMAIFVEPSMIHDQYFTTEGIRLIARTIKREIYHSDNTIISAPYRGHITEYKDEQYSIKQDVEDVFQSSKILNQLTIVERDVLGGQLQRYNRHVIARIAKISIDEVLKITKGLLGDEHIQRAFCIQMKRIREDIPKLKFRVRIDI